MRIETLILSLYVFSHVVTSCRTPKGKSSDLASNTQGSAFSCKFIIPSASPTYFEISGTPTSQGLLNVKGNYFLNAKATMKSLSHAPLAASDALISKSQKTLAEQKPTDRYIRSIDKAPLTIDRKKYTCFNISGVGPKKEDYLCVDSSLQAGQGKSLWVSDFRYASDLNLMQIPGSTCVAAKGSLNLDTTSTNGSSADAPPSADDAVQSAAAATATFNEVRPPDFFKDPAGSDRYLFPPNLEIPCESRSKYCPNYGVGGIPSNWVLARYKSRHAGGFDGQTASLLMVYVPPGATVNGKQDRVHRWLNFALPSDADPLDGQPTPLSPIPSEYSGYMPSTFTMVSVSEGTRPKVHFQRFRRSSSNDKFYVPLTRDDPVSCSSCHPNGPRAISPLGYHVNATEAADAAKMLEEANWRAVEKINNAMETATAGTVVDWDNGFDIKKFAPKYGLSTPKNRNTRTKEFILGTEKSPGCATAMRTRDVHDIFNRAPGRNNIYKMSEKPNLDWEKIRDAMDCQSCHDHNSRGAMTDDVEFSQIEFKILVDQSMPMGSLEDPFSNPERHYSNALDIDHRIALVNCLEKETDSN